jgi:hypothetical protein
LEWSVGIEGVDAMVGNAAMEFWGMEDSVISLGGPLVLGWYFVG